MPERRLSLRNALTAAAAYAALTVVLTWPLARSVATDVANDLGDPLLNAWILAWSGERLGQALGGDLDGLRNYWDANIFYPETGTLAYSEHLTAQALFSLPLRLFTRDPIVIYNIAFLATFPLCALGAFLLARELTGLDGAAFTAGLVFAFGPYRFEQLSHLQILSSQWMPLALLGLRLHFATGRAAALAGAVAALLLSNLSCGYYLFFFSPFVALYCLYEMADRGRLGDGRLWARLVLAAAVVVTLTLPFLLPYAEASRRQVLFRSRSEVEFFSADVLSYLTAPETSRAWGGLLRLTPEGERALFPSFTALVLAGLGIWAAGREACSRAVQGPPRSGPGGRWSHRVTVAALTWSAVHALLLILNMAGLPAPSPRRCVLLAAGGLLVAALVSERVRRFLRGTPGSAVGFCTLALGLAFWLSLGPTVRVMGRPLGGLGLYGILYEHVPGFQGLRVPARFAMIALLFLALLAAFGARELLRSRRGAIALVLAGGLFLGESSAAPIPLASPWREGGQDRFAERPFEATPPIYLAVARLPREAVIAELPFGLPHYDSVYMLHSTTHWRRMLNGTSGVYPASYAHNRDALRDVLANREEAWQTLRDSGATHVLVHEGLWGTERRGRKASDWLEQSGARLVARSGRDALFELPRP